MRTPACMSAVFAAAGCQGGQRSQASSKAQTSGQVTRLSMQDVRATSQLVYRCMINLVALCSDTVRRKKCHHHLKLIHKVRLYLRFSRRVHATADAVHIMHTHCFCTSSEQTPGTGMGSGPGDCNLPVTTTSSMRFCFRRRSKRRGNSRSASSNGGSRRPQEQTAQSSRRS